MATKKQKASQDVTNRRTAKPATEPAKPAGGMPPAVRPKNAAIRPIPADHLPPRTGVTRPRTKLTGGGAPVPIATPKVEAKGPAPAKGGTKQAASSKASAKATAKPSAGKSTGKSLSATRGGKKDLGAPPTKGAAKGSSKGAAKTGAKTTTKTAARRK